MRGSAAARVADDGARYGRARAVGVSGVHLPLVALAHAASVAATGARGRAAAAANRGNRGDGKSVTIRGVAAEQIGAVAWHGISDADTAGAALDAQLVAICRAVVSACGGDPSLINWFSSHEKTTDAAIEKDRAALVQRYLAGDRSAQINEAMQSTLPEHFALRVLESREKMEKSPYLELWDGAASPLFDEWKKWYDDKRHWYDGVTELTEAWESYLGWAKRVNALRDLVEKAGIRVGVPRMMDFPDSYKDKAEKGIGDMMDIVKVAIYGGLGIAGIAALAMISRGGAK